MIQINPEKPTTTDQIAENSWFNHSVDPRKTVYQAQWQTFISTNANIVDIYSIHVLWNVQQHEI